MKKLLIILALGACLISSASKVRADADVSLDFFYDNLSPYGNWIDVGDYGYCFQPAVAVDGSDWRPYSDGYWAYTDVGWTWVSYEDFGWATYHYGRWANLDSYGWVWVPGYEWGPAWVSWRTGGDYVGWAPLPPQGGQVVYEGRPINGTVDVTFDIGPLYYNFVDIRYIGEPVLRQRILPPARNVTVIHRTVNVTNITYSNSVVYNYGPNFNRLNQYSERPIPRLALKRETNFANNSTMTHGGNLNRVSNGQLMVVAPPVQKAQQKIAPKQVKATIAGPQIERGWKGINNRQQLQAEMTKENARDVAPPSFVPHPNYSGVMSSNGDGKREPGAIAAPPSPVTATQEGPQKDSEVQKNEPLQVQPGRQRRETPLSQPTNPSEAATPFGRPRQVQPLVGTERFHPTGPVQSNQTEQNQVQPAPRARRPQPIENQPSAGAASRYPEEAQRPPSTSSETGEHQAKPKKKRPKAEQTPSS